MLLLLFVCVLLPLHIAFSNNDQGWCITYQAIDTIFLIDLILQFFMTYMEEETNMDEITDRRLIALNYLKGWFIVDVLSILPFDYIQQIADGTFDSHSICPAPGESIHDHPSKLQTTNILFRSPKIGKIFRIIRLFRLVKIFKLIKNKEHLQKNLTAGLKINAGTERLVLLIISIIYIQHVCACFWLMIG